MKQRSKIKVCVITGSRAEYGLLYWTLGALQKDKQIQLQIIATGTHLSSEYGNTFKQIEKDGFKISEKIDILKFDNSPIGIAEAIGAGVSLFAKTLNKLKPDLILVVGDRFEIHSAVTAANVLGIPVAHCHGGEVTEGAYDEAFRHGITKMSHLHFTATEIYRKRVIQLGEDPKTVFNVGALGVENANKLKLLSKAELEKSLDTKLGAKNILVTFHPVTLEKNSSLDQFKDLIKALDAQKAVFIIFTKPNADDGSKAIIDLIDNYVKRNSNKAIAFTSLGQLRYLSLMKICDAVVGNSSSGIIETPLFKVPCVNIGSRQSGRIMADNLISCSADYSIIKKAIAKALSSQFKNSIIKMTNPYGKKNASQQIVSIIKKAKLSEVIKKKFYDIK